MALLVHQRYLRNSGSLRLADGICSVIIARLQMIRGVLDNAVALHAIPSPPCRGCRPPPHRRNFFRRMNSTTVCLLVESLRWLPLSISCAAGMTHVPPLELCRLQLLIFRNFVENGIGFLRSLCVFRGNLRLVDCLREVVQRWKRVIGRFRSRAAACLRKRWRHGDRRRTQLQPLSTRAPSLARARCGNSIGWASSSLAKRSRALSLGDPERSRIELMGSKGSLLPCNPEIAGNRHSVRAAKARRSVKCEKCSGQGRMVGPKHFR